MKKILTIILDGFGIREETEGNAVKMANLPNFTNFYENNPHTLLYASEEPIGLEKGQMGNSEIGHMSIGAGRLIKSPIVSINDFFKNIDPSNKNLTSLLNNKNRRVHIMGLASDGKIHSSVEHFIMMSDLLVNNGFTNIYYHLITDGRDTKVDVANNYVEMIKACIERNKVGSIATLCGRYFAMDRDKKWDRTKIYYDLLTEGRGTYSNDIKASLAHFYNKQITDEFMRPILCDEEGLIMDGDIIIWMNYREDRSKQILRSFLEKDFSEFSVKKYNDLQIYSLMEIDKDIPTKVLIPPEKINRPLGLYLSELGLRQARIAESEKYPHVTYFFDGGFDEEVLNIDKYHIPSPKVATYDMKPEMSAYEVTNAVCAALEKDYDFILVNFANPDMVGHTGQIPAVIKAIEFIDKCLGKIFEKANDNFYKVVLLADHGNCDTMINPDGTPCTTHSLARVPFVINDASLKFKNNGSLCNVAPTILEYMDISLPEEMTSESLITD